MQNEPLEGNPVIVSSASGGGKTSLITRLIECEGESVAFSVSATTRQPRRGEVDGKDYRFWTREAFLEGIEDDRFLEWAEVHGELYGTLREPAGTWLQQGRDVLFDIDVQGASSLKTVLPHAVTVFILPPSYSVLSARLQERRTETIESVHKRLEAAKKEILCYHAFEYFIINQTLQEAVSQLREIVRASRCRSGRMEPAVRRILETFDGKS